MASAKWRGDSHIMDTLNLIGYREKYKPSRVSKERQRKKTAAADSRRAVREAEFASALAVVATDDGQPGN